MATFEQILASAGEGELKDLMYADKKTWPEWLSTACLKKAAKGGHLIVMKYLLHECGAEIDEWCCGDAAFAGQLQALIVLRKHGGKFTKYTWADAAAGGHLHILVWGLENGFDVFSPEACEWAARGGHLDLLQWLRNNDCPWGASTVKAAASQGHLSVVQWARKNGCEWNHEALHLAAMNNHEEVAAWLVENGCPLDYQSSFLVAQKGWLGILQALMARGCPWGVEIYWAASRGHLNVVQWARQNGCPWDAGALRAAASGNQKEVAAWLVDNDCPFDNDSCIGLATQGWLTIMQSLSAREAAKGHLHFLWTDAALYWAVRNNQKEVAAWLVCNGCRVDQRSSELLDELSWLEPNEETPTLKELTDPAREPEAPVPPAQARSGEAGSSPRR